MQKVSSPCFQQLSCIPVFWVWYYCFSWLFFKLAVVGMISLLKIAQRDYWDKRQTSLLLVSPLVFSWELRELRLGRELFLCGPEKPNATSYVMLGWTDELDSCDAVLYLSKLGPVCDVGLNTCIHIHRDLLPFLCLSLAVFFALFQLV